MIDYTMDIRRRLDLGDEPPEVNIFFLKSKDKFTSIFICLFVMKDLIQRKHKVLATLVELQNEVKPITKAIEISEDSNNDVKDTKQFLLILQKEHDVSSNIVYILQIYINLKQKLICFSLKSNGLIVPIKWVNIFMNVDGIPKPFHIYIFVFW